MFDSSMYGLSNPAWTEDIGRANMDKMLPGAPASACAMSYMPAMGVARDNIILQGPLANDEVLLTQKQKDSKTWKTIFKIGGLIAIGALALKFGKNFASKCFNGIKSVFSKIKFKH